MAVLSALACLSCYNDKGLGYCLRLTIVFAVVISRTFPLRSIVVSLAQKYETWVRFPPLKRTNRRFLRRSFYQVYAVEEKGSRALVSLADKRRSKNNWREESLRMARAFGRLRPAGESINRRFVASPDHLDPPNRRVGIASRGRRSDRLRVTTKDGDGLVRLFNGG